MKKTGDCINVHHIIPVSTVNGPGKRTVIWVQGCIFSCTGCFNPGLQPFVPRKLMTPGEILDCIPISEVEGVTVSGGEPFCQAEGLCPLAEAVRDQGLSLMVYTGYEYHTLIQQKNTYREKLLAHIDILVDGPYKEDIKPNNPWAGSGNQGILFLTDRYSHLKDDIFLEERYTEFHIGKDGLVKTTGF
jgi:anaerobic ribonucleoside-triphosphate reductase activating protein